MKIAKKLLLSIMIIATVLFGSYSVVALAAEEIHPAGDVLTYTVLNKDEKTVKVSDCESNQTSITIPASVDGYTVTEINEDMFNGYSTLETLTFADGCQIEAINDVFNNCTGLKEINWGKDTAVKEITNSFKSCTSLEKVTIPKSVETIGKHSFSNCLKLSTLSFETGSKLKTIEKEAFAYLGKDEDTVPATIASLTLPASLETLDESAFHCIPVEAFALEDNSKLAEIPDGFLAADGEDGKPGYSTVCTSLWDYVKKAYVSLTSPYPETPEKVAKACACLKSVDFGDNNSLTRIGMGAFKNQVHLTSLDFGSTPKAELTIARGAFIAIGNNAYFSSEALGNGFDTIVIPANVKEIEDGVFQDARIKNIVISDNSKLVGIPNNFLSASDAPGYPGGNPIKVATNCLQTIKIGKNNSLASIGAAAFSNQSHLTSIDFGTSTVGLSINNSAFSGVGNNANLVSNNVDKTASAGIDTVVFPANLVNLYEGAFKLSKVKHVEFADNCQLTRIPSHFLGLDGSNSYPYTSPVDLAANCLETVKLGKGNSLATIGYGAFRNQSHVISIDFGTSKAELVIQYGAFTGVGNNASLVGNGYDSQLCAGIEKLVLPANLKTMNEGAFEIARVKNFELADGCKLTAIPSNFLGIDGSNGYSTTSPVYMAANCLETIKFGKGNSLALINYGAFRNQSHLTSIDFGTSSVALEINTSAFTGVGNNANLVDNHIDSELNAGIEKLVLPANLKTMQDGAFEVARVKNLELTDGCQLTAIPSNFLGIDGSNGYSTTSPVYIASNCLETIKFGKDNSLDTINYGAFRNQSHLTSIDFGTSNAALVIQYSAFTGVGNNANLVDNRIDSKLCNGIENLVLPANLKTMQDGAFEVARVKNVELADGCQLTAIPNNFLGIDGSNGTPSIDSVDLAANCLETVNLGNNSLALINYGAFRNQSHLTSIDFGSSNAELVIQYSAFTGVGNNGYLVEQGIDNELLDGIDTLAFPTNLTNLYSGFEYARVKNVEFCDNCQLKSIPSGFMQINGNAYNGCPGKAYSNGEYIFDYNLAQIASNALETIKFGNNLSLNTIGSGAFGNQSHVTAITFGEDSDNITIDYGAFVGVGNNAYLVENDVDEELNSGINTLVLPANLATLNSGAFDYAKIKNLKFADNCKLSEIPNGFMQIGGANGIANTDVERVGGNCLESVDFGKNNSLTAIGRGAFHYQSNLSNIQFGNNANDDKLIINDGAFQGLASLEMLYMDSDCAVYSLAGGVFSNCNNLTTVNLRNSNINSFDDCLKENPNLKTIIFPEKSFSIKWTKYVDPSTIDADDYSTQEDYEEAVENRIDRNNKTCVFYGCGNINKLVFATNDFDVTQDGALQFVNETGTVCVPEGTSDEDVVKYKSLLGSAGLSFDEGKWTIEGAAYRDIKFVPKKSPTCTEGGNTQYYYCVEGDNVTYYADAAATTVIEKDSWNLPATGHKWGAWTSKDGYCHKRVCSNDRNHIEATYHTYTVTVTAPTCVKAGKNVYICKGCGDMFTEYVPATGKHSYKDTVTPATATANGSIVKKCSVCDDTKTTTIKKIASVKLSATKYIYDGKVKTPSVVVKDSAGKALVKGTDYTVSYPSGRKNVGKYTVKVIFKGNYKGTKSLSFVINPKSTSISSLTAIKAGFKVTWKKQTTQTTGYQIQYSTSKEFKSAKTVTVSKNTTVSKSISKLSKGKKYYVRVRTYKTVGKTKYYSSWSASKYVTTKK